jgi:hypothetical protein
LNGIVIGKRIPIGAAVSGIITFSGHMWNLTHPDAQLSVAEIATLAVPLTAIAQVIVVNTYGVTQADKK